jgi:glucose-1-phosphate cytidylyltransferase
MKLKTAVVLCGGRGTRLGSIGNRLPKTLVKIKGKPIIWYIIKQLQKNSINHFILPVGYKGSMIKKYFEDNKEFNRIKIDIIETGKNTPISKRIFKIKNFIESKNFILLNGDAIFMFNIKKFFQNHIKKKNLITFLGCETNLSYGVVGVERGKVKSFERDKNFFAVKMKSKKDFTGYIYSGISIMNTTILKNKFKNLSNFEKQFYPLVIKKYKSGLEIIDGLWYSIDSQKDLDYLTKKTDNFIESKLKLLQKKLS